MRIIAIKLKGFFRPCHLVRRGGVVPAIRHQPRTRTLQVHALTQEMKARGERVVSLCVGEPDFQPPPAVTEATAAAAKEVSFYNSALFGHVPSMVLLQWSRRIDLLGIIHVKMKSSVSSRASKQKNALLRGW